jgi:hypothetical protein
MGVPHDDEVTRQYSEAIDQLNRMYRQFGGRPASSLDEQSRAYREMTAEDAVPDAQIDQWISRRHAPLDAELPLAQQLLLPADYERVAWDRDRVDSRRPT